MCFVLVLQVFKWWFLCCRSMLSPDWFFLPSSSGIHLMQSTQSRSHLEIMSPPPSSKQQEKLSHVSPQQSHAKGSSFLFTAHAYSTLKFWSKILPMACKYTQHHEMLLHTRVTRWVTSGFLGRFSATPEVCMQQQQRVRFASTKEEGEEAAALASTFFGNNHRGNVSEGWFDGFFGSFLGNIFLDNKERLWERFWQRPRRQHVRERFRKAVLWRDGLLFWDLGRALVPVNEVSRRKRKRKARLQMCHLLQQSITCLGFICSNL